MSEPARTTEFTLINWFRQRERSRSGREIKQGIGDDCAILAITTGCDLLVTTDMLMDGRHFRLEQDGPEAVGYKALGVNLSDIAAMAGVPRAVVVAVALPRREAIAVAQGVYNGMRPLAEQFQVDLVGGDTNAWDGPLVVNITLLGETTARGPVRRSGARAGDAILVTGLLGGSLGSGRHLRPQPRIAEALALHAATPIHAMIDISDGLSSDLGHILEESGAGAIVERRVDSHSPRLLGHEPTGRSARPRPRTQRWRGFRALPGHLRRRRNPGAGGATGRNQDLPDRLDH